MRNEGYLFIKLLPVNTNSLRSTPYEKPRGEKQNSPHKAWTNVSRVISMRVLPWLPPAAGRELDPTVS